MKEHIELAVTVQTRLSSSRPLPWCFCSVPVGLLRPLLLRLSNCTHVSCPPPLSVWRCLSVSPSPPSGMKRLLFSPDCLVRQWIHAYWFASGGRKKEREGEGRRKRRLHSHSLPDFMTPRGACSISSRKFQLSPFLSPSQPHSTPAGYQQRPELYQPRPKSSTEPKPFANHSPSPLCLHG